MSELPILFSGPMVRAILDGRKTMTRRVAIPRYDDRTPCEHWHGDNSGMGPTMFRHCCHGSEGRGCPHGLVGDRLWVRETWATWPSMDTTKPSRIYQQSVHYFATFDESKILYAPSMPKKWRPSIFMPRWASRITLEIVSVKVERVQEISKEDAIAEGVEAVMVDGHKYGLQTGNDYKWAFNQLWDSINAKRGYGWDVNPWVWAVTFKRVK